MIISDYAILLLIIWLSMACVEKTTYEDILQEDHVLWSARARYHEKDFKYELMRLVPKNK